MKNISQLIMDVSNVQDKGITFITNNKETYVSYSETYSKALKMLNFLQGQNMGKGSHLLFQIEDNEAVVILIWACLLGGIVPVPCACGYNEKHLNFLQSISKSLNNPTIVISNKHDSFLRKFSKRQNISFDLLWRKKIIMDDLSFLEDEIAGSVEVNEKFDETLILFSSGTTGQPKGIAYNNYNLMENILAVTESLKFRRDDRELSWTPLHHVLGLIFHFLAIFSQVNQYLMSSTSFVQHPLLWLELISKYQITISFSPNFGYKLCVDSAEEDDTTTKHLNLTSLRMLITGAEPISMVIINQFISKFEKYGLKKRSICAGYGLTEASVVTMSEIDEEIKVLCIDREQYQLGQSIKISESENNIIVVSQGKFYACSEVLITDEEGRKLPEGTIGYIQICGNCVADRYYSERGIFPLKSETGWLDTKDCGFLYKGELYVTGRMKDMIIIHGKNYFLNDVEQVIESLQRVEKGSVVCLSHFNAQEGTENIIAMIEWNETEKETEFAVISKEVKFVVNRNLGLEITRVLPVSKIEKTANGKIQRHEMLKLYEEYLITQ
ncbi:AMP-binding protein [Paenibacillus monticola]|uniref:AMP-binding protein n=1 Tax=Paenibacillus monticola TaxID=2666075 RepID=A0A7X2HBR8_9BACL|nr:AMP-binding protein [Paenibacillus monticola]MRN57179.1 AMP-binding protein [Paenibacillus monticola]